MYKLLLCWRYLLTRYIALASIVSVMLGVATMIVVNAVMLGFTTEMQNRIHGILSDVIFQSNDIKGFPNAQWHMDEMRKVAGDLIDEMTPTVFVPGMITYRVGSETRSCPVDMIGIDCVTQGRVSEIMQYLQHPENRKQLSFQLREEGYDVWGAGKKKRDGVYRYQLGSAGWEYRRSFVAEQERFRKRLEEEERRKRQQIDPSAYSLSPSLTPKARQTEPLQSEPELPKPAIDPFSVTPSFPGNTTPGDIASDGLVTDDALSHAQPEDPFKTESNVFDPAKEQHAGAIVGIGLSSISRTTRRDDETGKKIVQDHLLLMPGDDVMLTFPTTSMPIRLQTDNFTVVDLYESKMAEYDSKMVFVPIEKLQELRGMYDPQTGDAMVSQILIKAKPGVDLKELRGRLQGHFPSVLYTISTWQDVKENILAAVFMEIAILNVLLLLIFAVAGFGILAIFYMIVVEKTKDIGIMKSLGAGAWGIMQIFLYYSLLLGIVGSVLGVILGLTFVHYIKEIADVLTSLTNHNVFDPEIYSFYEIPTIVEPRTVCLIIFVAILIAMLSSILPALRAARLHPVESLRS